MNQDSRQRPEIFPVLIGMVSISVWIQHRYRYGLVSVWIQERICYAYAYHLLRTCYSFHQAAEETFAF